MLRSQTPFRATILLAAALLAWGAAAHGEPTRSIRLTAPVAHVVDGDTFDADLNGDGRVDVPGERVRLRFVDTPELHASPKGQDVAHGLPAKAALEALLRAGPLVLQVPVARPHDTYGRTLARVAAGDVDVSRSLVRAGHSAVDTRFGFPEDYPAFLAAEVEAFDARRGIWADAPSRKRYLARLKSEGRTPQSAQNPAYVAAPQRTVAAAKLLGKYVTVEGTLALTRPVTSGARLFSVTDGGGALTVFASRFTVEHLGAAAWRVGQAVHVSGFIQRYKGKVEMALHHATLP